AGLLHGLLRGFDWPTTGRIASLMGAMKIAQPGTQNHRFSAEEFAAGFKRQFGHAVA
ncbi:MAG: carbohydrate kinase family protein, partial [Pseudomonadota bacterium]